MRWTDGLAILEFPALGSKERTIQFRAMGLRPPQISATEVQISLDGQVIGKCLPIGGWNIYTFKGLTAPAQGYSKLQFSTATFNPALIHYNNDTRNLGFLLDWVRIR